MVKPEESLNPLRNFDEVKYKMPMPLPRGTKSDCWISQTKQYLNDDLHLNIDTAYGAIPMLGLVASFITYGIATEMMLPNRYVIVMVWYSLAFIIFCAIQVKWAYDGYKNPEPLFLWINSKGFEWFLIFAALIANPRLPHVIIYSLLLTLLTALICVGYTKYNELKTRNANVTN